MRASDTSVPPPSAVGMNTELAMPTVRPCPAIAPQDHVLPIRPPDLVRLLLKDSRLGAADRVPLQQFCKLLGAVYHHEFLATLRKLEDLYAPLDPDCDCVQIERTDCTVRPEDVDAFIQTLEPLLVEANYRQLGMEDIKQAVAEPNEMGLNYVPDFDLFDRVEVWVRGDTRVIRHRRKLRARFRPVEISLDAYQRLLVILKFKPGPHLGNHARSDVLYLRMFKDVPHVDMEMNLPEQGAKVRMRAIDKAQIASPLAVSLPTMLWKSLFSPVLWKLFNLGFLSFAIPVNIAAALVIAPVSAGVNSFFGFQRAKQRHLSYMIRQLYYMTLANNGSVLCRLIDSAEDEEFKEAILAYFMLWICKDDPEPWTSPRLDATIEQYLRERAGVTVDFDVADALAKLITLRLASANEQGAYRVVSPTEARDLLDRRWDGYFTYTG